VAPEMIRVLFIARYRDPTMDRKVQLMSETGDLAIHHVRPRYWNDELLCTEQTTVAHQSLHQVAVSMVGRSNDAHRAVYRTLDFGMRGFRPHIVHAEEEPDSLAALQISMARRLFAPGAHLILHTWQNIKRPRRPWVRLVQVLTLNAADGVMCASREAQAILQREGYRGQSWVLPAIGVDTRVFHPCTHRRAGEGFVVGYVGRLVPEKGLDTLLAAMQLLNAPSILRIVGDGPLRDSLQGQARQLELGERVEISPPLPPVQIAAAMCQLDVLVLPSRTTRVWKEQFGRVLVEAMACQVPVVGSDSGAIPEVIGDAGLIFPEGDAHALAGCLRRLIQSPAMREELAVRGYQRVGQHYTQEHIARCTSQVYREILAKRQYLPASTGED
jgi:glycosyltransferase involved in cell wall biosynthesis